MNTHIYYWIAFLIYAITVIGIGFFVWFKEKKAGKQTSNEAYWQASRNLSSWSVGLSISASMMSISWSCVYDVQLFYWYGWGGAWLLIIPWLVTMAGFFFFAGLFRKFNVFSQPQLLEKRFGGSLRQYLAPALIIVFITWTGAEIYAAGTIIAPFLGIPLIPTLFLITLVVAVYSYSGGFEAVVSTDKIQFVLVAVFISAVAFLAYGALPQGQSLFEVPAPPKANTGLLFFTPGIALIFITFFAYLPGWLIETDVWIRLQAGRTDKVARKGVLIASLNSLIFVGIMPAIIGVSALILFPAVNGTIPAELGDGALIFTVIMSKYAPVWLNVFLSIGLIAAAMSTVDTCGNVVALSFSHDLLEPLLKKKWPEERLNRLARLSSVAAIFAAFIYAVFTESLWDIFYLSSGILTTSVFIPVLGSFLPRTRPAQVKYAIIAGLASTLIFYFLETRGYLAGIEPRVIAETELGYIIWGFLFSLAGFALAGLRPEPQRKV